MKLLLPRVRLHLGKRRCKATHRFVQAIWGLMNQNTCERVPEKDKRNG